MLETIFTILAVMALVFLVLMGIFATVLMFMGYQMGNIEEVELDFSDE